MRVFMFGDYEFLCNAYGLSGASGKPHCQHVHVCVCVENYSYNIGRHCCLWCDITYEQMQTSRDLRGASPEWSLDILSRDYQHFVTTGRGNIKVAKLYNNVIRERLFDVPLDQVRQ